MPREAPGHPSACAEKALGQRGGAALPEERRQTAFSKASPSEVSVTRADAVQAASSDPWAGHTHTTCSDTPGHPRPVPSALSHHPLQGLSPGVGVSCRSQKDPCPTHRGPAGPGAPGAQTLTCGPGVGGGVHPICLSETVRVHAGCPAHGEEPARRDLPDTKACAHPSAGGWLMVGRSLWLRRCRPPFRPAL